MDHENDVEEVSVSFENSLEEGSGATPSSEQTSKKRLFRPKKALKAAVGSAKEGYTSLKQDTHNLANEIQVECFQLFEVYEVIDFIRDNWYKAVYVPYLPAFHHPGWLLRYCVGPYSTELIESFFADIIAGITVALTLIPQALSYASLANLPAINGLYTATLPSATYTFFGSSMQLAVGPVALVSLLQAQLITKYDIEPQSAESVDFAAECAIAVATILVLMSIFNMGDLIRFISHPVMSAFTTAAALVIGQNQLKGAFGFVVSPPQAGQEGYEWNYEVMKWYSENWNLNDASTSNHNVRNPYATKICLGLYFGMIFFVVLKNWIKPTPARKKTWVWTFWTLFVNLLPLVAIVVGGHLAWQIKHDDHYHEKDYDHDFYASKLSIVGIVPAGLDFIRAPKLKWDFGILLGDVFPTAIILFMESWSVAQRIATQNNQMHLLNASQELWAVACANFLSGICSGYPVAGSFSRSSLNHSAGAKTPLSKATTMIAIILTLRFFTRTFQYIPSAALSAVIWVAIFNLVCISDFWHAWKHSKKDFFVMLVTAVTVYVTDTGVGLAVGIGANVLVLLADTAFNPENAPVLINTDEEHEKGLLVHLRFRNDFNFLTAGRFSDFVTNFTLLQESKSQKQANLTSWNERAFHTVADFLDSWLRPQLAKGVPYYPRALVLDMGAVCVIDVTALHTIEDMARVAHEKGISFLIINASPVVAKQIAKFGYKNDNMANLFRPEISLRYNDWAGDIIPMRDPKITDEDSKSESNNSDEEKGLMMRTISHDHDV
eukprot:gene1661-1816_t